MNLDLLKKGKNIKVYSVEFEDEVSTEILEIDKISNLIKIKYIDNIYAMKPEKDERVKVKIPRKDALYYFNTRIENVFEKKGYYTVKIPSEILRKQERNFVRIEVNISLNIITDKIITKGVTVNMSGGGICFFCKTHFQEDQIITISFKTTNGKMYKNLKVKIKHVKVLPENIFEYGSKFMDIKPIDRENIISYLLELEIKRKIKDSEKK